MHRKLLTLSIALAVGSTAVVGAYVIPNPPVDPQYSAETQRMVRDAVLAQDTIDAVQPKKIEVDLTAVVQTALAHNHDLKAARAQLAAAEARVSLASASKNPKISVGGSINRSGSSATVTLPTGNKMSVSQPTADTRGVKLNVSLPLYTGGLAEGNIAAARLGKEAAEAKVVQTEQDVKLKATKAYFDALKARNMEQVANLAVEDIQKHLKTVTLQYQVGVAAKSDVLATEVALANAQTQQIQAKNAVSLSQAALAQVMAMPVNTIITLKDRDFAHVPYTITLDEATGYALSHRAELYQAVLGAAAAKEQIGIARAGYRPMVQLTGSKGWAFQSPTSPRTIELPGGQSIPVQPTGHGQDWSMGVQASWSLWDGGTTRANVKSAQAAYDAALQTRANAISGISLEVRQAYLNLHEAEGTMASSEVGVRQGTENFRIASLRYSAGVGTNLDVLDAELNLTKARTNHINALYNYNVSGATLERAMGTPVYAPFGAGLQSPAK